MMAGGKQQSGLLTCLLQLHVVKNIEKQQVKQAGDRYDIGMSAQLVGGKQQR
jgi:hypothetical protein